MGVAAGVIAFVSAVSSYQRRKKAKRKAARRRDASLGQEVRSNNSAEPIPALYGYTATTGIPVWTGAASTFNTSASYASLASLPRVGRLVNNNNSGARNTYLCQQHVLSVGEGLRVREMWTDEQRPNTQYITGSSWGEVRHGTASTAAAHFLADRGTATFSGLTYATTVHKLNRQDPQYSGPPIPIFFCQGKTVRPINRSGSPGSYTYSLGTAAFSTNAVLVLLDYMLNDFGPNWSWNDDVDKEAFYEAAQIAGQVVQSRTGVTGTTFTPALTFPYAFINEAGFWQGSGLDTYGGAFAALGLSSRTGWQDNKGSWPASVLSRDVLRYEFNGPINTDRDWQDNLTLILGVIPGGEIFRTTAGKWKVVVPDSLTAEAAQSVGTVTEDDLVSAVEVNYPDTTERLNQLDIEFNNINKDFSADALTFPEPATDPLSLYTILRAEDQNRRLGRKIRVPGLVDEYHANSWACNTILASRRPFYVFETRPSGFLYEPGDVIRLVDNLAGVDKHVRVAETRVRDNLNVTISAIEFDKDDYGWNPTGFVRVVDLGGVPTSILPPINLVARNNTADRTVTLSWNPNPQEDITVDSYVVERRIGTGNFTTASTVSHGGNFVTLLVGSAAQTLSFRVRARSSQNALSAPSSTVSLTFAAFTGTPGATGATGARGTAGWTFTGLNGTLVVQKRPPSGSVHTETRTFEARASNGVTSRLVRSTVTVTGTAGAVRTYTQSWTSVAGSGFTVSAPQAGGRRRTVTSLDVSTARGSWTVALVNVGIGDGIGK